MYRPENFRKLSIQDWNELDGKNAFLLIPVHIVRNMAEHPFVGKECLPDEKFFCAGGWYEFCWWLDEIVHTLGIDGYTMPDDQESDFVELPEICFEPDFGLEPVIFEFGDNPPFHVYMMDDLLYHVLDRQSKLDGVLYMPNYSDARGDAYYAYLCRDANIVVDALRKRKGDASFSVPAGAGKDETTIHVSAGRG